MLQPAAALQSFFTTGGGELSMASRSLFLAFFVTASFSSSSSFSVSSYSSSSSSSDSSSSSFPWAVMAGKPLESMLTSDTFGSSFLFGFSITIFFFTCSISWHWLSSSLEQNLCHAVGEAVHLLQWFRTTSSASAALPASKPFSHVQCADSSSQPHVCCKYTMLCFRYLYFTFAEGDTSTRAVKSLLSLHRLLQDSACCGSSLKYSCKFKASLIPIARV